LFVPQELVRERGTFDVPRILHPLWWIMYQTIGRLEHWLERQNPSQQ
jgi:hypothetical protein